MRRLRRLVFVACAVSAAALSVLASSAVAAPLAVAGAAPSSLDMWNAIVAFALPPLIAVVKQTHWPAKAQAVLAFAACCAAAAGTSYWKADLTGKTWAYSAMVILTGAIATYYGFWKPTGAADRIAKVTDVSKPKPPPRPPASRARTRKPATRRTTGKKTV